jgi:hypothetical protein
LRLNGLREQNGQLSRQLSFMRSPGYLEKRIYNLGLRAPAPQAVWRIAEPQPESPKSLTDDRQFAAGRGTAGNPGESVTR